MSNGLLPTRRIFQNGKGPYGVSRAAAIPLRINMGARSMKGIYDIRQQNLKFLIEEKFDGSQSRLAEQIHIEQPSFISRLLSINPKTRKNIGANLARKIERAAGKPPYWLDQSRGWDGTRAISEAEIEGPAIRRVPLLAWAEVVPDHSMGKNKIQEQQLEAREQVVCPAECGPRTYALRVRGISMQNPTGRPSFHEGDLIFVDPDVEPRPGRHVIAQVPGSPEPIFRTLVEEGGRQFLRALNPTWSEIPRPVENDVTILGVVIFKSEAV
jgi:SOS-response transcriptional repressor LexA